MISRFRKMTLTGILDSGLIVRFHRGLCFIVWWAIVVLQEQAPELPRKRLPELLAYVNSKRNADTHAWRAVNAGKREVGVATRRMSGLHGLYRCQERPRF
jgi:hypothetical protein